MRQIPHVGYTRQRSCWIASRKSELARSRSCSFGSPSQGFDCRRSTNSCCSFVSTNRKNSRSNIRIRNLISFIFCTVIYIFFFFRLRIVTFLKCWIPKINIRSSPTICKKKKNSGGSFRNTNHLWLIRLNGHRQSKMMHL